MNTNKKIIKSVINKTPNIQRVFQLIIAAVLYIFTLFLLFPTYMQKPNIPAVGDIVKEPLIVKRNVRYENKDETQKLEYYAKASASPIFDMPEGDSGGIGVDIAIPEFPTKLITELCHCYTEILKQKDTLVEIDAPIYIFGDIHGNIFDLLRLLIYSRTPPQTRLLFLGD